MTKPWTENDNEQSVLVALKKLYDTSDYLKRKTWDECIAKLKDLPVRAERDPTDDDFQEGCKIATRLTISCRSHGRAVNGVRMPADEVSVLPACASAGASQ